jgi:transposase-like protein
MPVPKKKSTTSNTNPVALEQASPALPEQQTFHEHLRALTRSAVRVVIEEVMREELKQFLGAAWGECTPERKGYRNGSYTRDLATSSGLIEDRCQSLEIGKDTSILRPLIATIATNRRLAEGLTQMFVAGVSTRHPWEKWPKR